MTKKANKDKSKMSPTLLSGDVCGTEVRIFPGGVECLITVADEAGFITYKGWIHTKDLTEVDKNDRCL